MAKVDLKIYGMDCAEEVATLKARLQPMPGVADLTFNILAGRLTVTYSDTGVTQDDLIAAISETGMRAERFPEGGTIARESTRWARWGRTVLTITSGSAIMAGFLVHAGTLGWQAAIGDQRNSDCAVDCEILLYRGHRRRQLVCRSEGVACRHATTSRHEPFDDHRRDWRTAHRGVVRGGHGLIPVRSIARPGIVERRPCAPGNCSIDGHGSSAGPSDWSRKATKS